MPANANNIPTYIAHISDEDLFAALNIAPHSFGAGTFEFNSQSDTILFRDADDLLATRDEAVQSFEPQRTKILLAAERVLRHDIQGWGDISIQHGPIVDFNADYGKNGKYGFHYWFWARPLIQAFLLTHDEKYLAEFESLFNAWYVQRDQIRGDIENLDVIYYELGLGLRVRTFLEFFSLPFAARSQQTRLNMLKTFLGSARWLFAHESESYRPGNWQIMGCTGLAWIAAFLAEFRDSPAWADLAATRLSEHLEKDLYADGCHWERVPSSYMLTVYKDIRNAATLMQLRSCQGINPTPGTPKDGKDGGHLELRTQNLELLDIDRMLYWYAQILPPDNIIPAINDGPRLPMPPRLLQEARQKFPEANKSSIHLPASGFTVLRDDSLHMLINHGPPAGGHTHHDALSFELHVGIAPVAIDSGIGKTYDDPLHESWYTIPAAHNMLEVVGTKLDRAAAEGSDVFFAQSPLLEYFAATHHGYEKSAGIIHRRHILFARQNYFLLIDEIQAARLPI